MHKTSKILILPFVLVATLLLASCAHKSGHLKNDRAQSEQTESEEIAEDGDTPQQKVNGHTKVHMRKEGGVYLVPITVNGLNLDFIFDTGASSISISSAEATVMVRQGKITQDDIVGQQQFQDATGSVSVGTVVRLRSVQIGSLSLSNVEASVVDNLNAPLLLGQTALAKFGKVTIDYEENTIEFN